MIHEEICTYELCKLAKEKGFDEECREFYCDDKSQKRITIISCNRHVTSFDYCSNSMLEDYYPSHEYCYISAPIQSLLQRWLREEKKLHITINSAYEWGVDDLQYPQERNISVGIGAFGLFDTYEDALEDALKYSLEKLV